MTRSLRRPMTIAGAGLAAAGGLLALSLAGPGVALADPSPSPSGSVSATAPADPKADRAAKRTAEQDALAEALATELGIDKAKVAAALEKVRTQRAEAAKADRIAGLKTHLDAAVTEGKLTREQADAILKAAENGVLPGGPGRAGPGGFGGGRGPGR